MINEEGPDRWLEITSRHETYRTEAGFQEQLEMLYKTYIEGGRTDRVLELTLLGGDTWVVPLSRIDHYIICTKDGFDKAVVLNKHFRSEKKSLDPDGE